MFAPLVPPPTYDQANAYVFAAALHLERYPLTSRPTLDSRLAVAFLNEALKQRREAARREGDRTAP